MNLQIQTIDLPKEYGVTDAAIAAIAAKYVDLKEIKDSASLGMALAGRRECRELRVAVEHKRKELKAGALEFGRKVDGEAKRITEQLEAIETPLDALVKAEEARKEEERQAKLRAIAEAEAKERARVDGIKETIEIKFGAYRQLGLPALSIGDLTQILHITEEIRDGYAEFTEEAKAKREEFLAMVGSILQRKQDDLEAAWQQRQVAEKLAEERRQFEEQQRLAREQEAAEQAERDRLEAERQAALRAEQEKLESERAEIRRQQEAFEEVLRLAEEERAAKERAAAEAIRQKELAEQAKIRAEQELKEQQAREEHERLAREEAERNRLAYEESLRPDKEKLRALAVTLVATPFPVLSTMEGNKAIARIDRKLDELAKFIVAQADKLEDSHE